MRIAIYLVCLLFATTSYGAAYTSSGSGDWSVAATWGGAGVPGIGDTATIQAGHRVAVDGDISVGTSPGSTATYDLDISGILQWPANPGADWTFTVYSSVRIQGSGQIQIASDGSPLDCSDHGIFEFATSAAGQKYYLNITGGSLSVHGCENYDTSSGAVHRARISACAPDCTAGAGKTITLDRDVNWNASAGWDGDRIIIGVGGSVANPPAAADDPEQITSWTAPAANQIGNVTFTEDHEVGDLVVNASKNFIFRSDSATVHARIYAAAGIDDPYDLNWCMLDEMGDNTSTAAGLYMSSATNTLGTISYVAALNCEDSGAVACMYLNFEDWTTFEGITAFDYRGGYGLRYQAPRDVNAHTASELTFFEGANGLGYGLYLTNVQHNVVFDGIWTSHGSYGVYSTNSTFSLTDSIIHGNTIDGVVSTEASSYTRTIQNTFSGNEIRNITRNCLEIQGTNSYISNNDIDTCGDNCLYIDPLDGAFFIYSDGNTYDNCNTDNSVSQAGIFFNDFIGYYHANNESFGQTNANYRANIMFTAPSYTSSEGFVRAVCNNCLLATPTNALTCASMPSDGIYLYGCNWNTAYIPQESYFNLHNKDQVEYSIVGWGPGGAVVSRDTATTSTNSNVKMKIVPLATNSYGCHSVGSFYTDSGNAIEARIYLRKDEAVATAGWRPRLALQGCGFEMYNDYAEMSDVNNTWEQVTVTGTSEWRGVVHVYVCARGKLSGADSYTPVWPPTLEVWADGLEVDR